MQGQRRIIEPLSDFELLDRIIRRERNGLIQVRRHL